MRETHVQAGLEPVVDLALDVGAAGHTLEVGHLDETFLVEVAEGEHVLVGLVTAGNGHLVLLADRLGIGAQFQPVVVPLGGDAVHDLAGVVVEEFGDRLGERIVLLVHAEDGIGAAGHLCRSHRAGGSKAVAIGHEVVLVHVIDILGPLVGVEGVVARNGAGGDTDIGLEGDLGATLATALGGDDDDAVRTAGTIERTGGSVLDDGHRLDVVGVEGVDRAVVRHAVNDIERGGGSVDGTVTADDHGSARTRLTGTGSGLDTGGHTVEGLGDVGDGPLFDLLGLDRLGRSREGLFLRRTISDDEHVGKHFRIGLECDGNHPVSGSVDDYLFSLVADGGEHEGASARNFDRVVAFEIGDSTRPGSFQHDRCSRQRLIGNGILDGSGNRDVLREGSRHGEEHQRKKNGDFLHKLNFG